MFKIRNFLGSLFTKEKDEYYRNPTPQIPITIKGIDFYSEHYVVKGNTINYDSIVGIYYRSSITTTNYLFTSYDITLYYETITNGKTKKVFVVTKSIFDRKLLGSYLSKSDRNKILIVKDVMFKYSFARRYNRYVNTINKKGFFPYDKYDFYKNGDIRRGKKFITNLNKEFANKNVMIGTGWKGWGTPTSYNPYEFYIGNGGSRFRFLGIEFGGLLKFDTAWNNDVFLTLIEFIRKNGSFPSQLIG